MERAFPPGFAMLDSHVLFCRLQQYLASRKWPPGRWLFSWRLAYIPCWKKSDNFFDEYELFYLNNHKSLRIIGYIYPEHELVNTNIWFTPETIKQGRICFNKQNGVCTKGSAKIKTDVAFCTFANLSAVLLNSK